ncbi:MAG: hypothetical protein HZA54_06325 [Planctomycetes bacterium]|nr:hypothetical protein [Planctomycetota bacterium]
MQEKYCLNHRDVAAVGQCHQCHKPVCGKCLVTAPNGKFCSPECQKKNQNFKDGYKEPKLHGPGLVSQLAGLAVGVGVLMLLIHGGVRFLGLNFLAGVDMIGKVLGK